MSVSKPIISVSLRLIGFSFDFLFQKRKACNNNRKPKDTSQITVGWKHRSAKTNSAYQMVTEQRGGGKLHLDISKDVSTKQLQETITEKYFPGGENLNLGLEINQLTSFLANFTGQQLPSEITTFGEFLQTHNTSPVRIYLHTHFKVNIQ